MATMNFANLLTQLDSVNKKKTYEDNSAEYWKPTKDKAGNASALIRFLPNKDVSDFPFVRLFTHSFKNEETGRWYIENSLSTPGIDANDYIGELNRELWNSGLEENKKIAGKQKRKLNYISNILIIKDTGNPENNGKVLKFKYGQKIFEKIVAAAKPDESMGDEPINAFDPNSGADFQLKQKVVANFPNYDDSKFSSMKELCSGDQEEIDKVLAQCSDLNAEVASDKFKTYDELKDKFEWVMGLKETGKGSGAKAPKKADPEKEADQMAEMAKEASKAEKKKPPMPVATLDDSDDDNAALFASLLDD